MIDARLTIDDSFIVYYFDNRSKDLRDSQLSGNCEEAFMRRELERYYLVIRGVISVSVNSHQTFPINQASLPPFHSQVAQLLRPRTIPFRGGDDATVM